MRLLLFVLFLVSMSHAQANLSVGLASMDVTPAVQDQIPLGGYGSIERRNWPFRPYERFPFLRFFRVAQGKLDPIRVKAMYLQKNNSKLLFISMDVIGVTKEMRKDLARRLKPFSISESSIIVSGTHTHSGPGALSNNIFWQIFAMDRFQRLFYERFMFNLMKTVKDAMANSRPAELMTMSFGTENLVRNRRGGDRPLNKDANFLVARALDGEWLGGLVNYAVHGTSLGADNLFFSSDVPGAIERELENMTLDFNGLVRLNSNPKFLFINGAEGDVSPNMNYLNLGVEFANQTKAQWHRLAPMTSSWSVRQKEIRLTTPKVNIRKCVDETWMPKGFKIGLGRFLSSRSVINQVRFGNLWFLTWPGEPTTELGLNLAQLARDQGADEAWVFGLTNDHLAYFTTADEFNKGGYEACVNLFGAQGGQAVINAHKKLSK